jgi:anti-sigma factor RsiW
MDCRAFRNSHVSFVDDTLPGVEHQAMEEHLQRCRQCAEHDARVRRSLMAARSLEPIVPSTEFSSRLRSRLDAERLRLAVPVPLMRGPSLAAFAATAAALVAVGVLAVELQLQDAAPPLEPVLRHRRHWQRPFQQARLFGHSRTSLTRCQFVLRRRDSKRIRASARAKQAL